MGEFAARSMYPDGTARRPKIFVCRGCCCGTRKKHPHSDAGRLEKILRRAARSAGMKYQTTKCLGPCGQGNVVVVRAAGTHRWFRKLDDVDETSRLAAHLIEYGDAEGVELPHRRMRGRDGRKPRGK